MRRSIASLMAVFFSLVLFVPSPASARGIPLKGNLISSARPVVAWTGSCACVWSWNTVSLGTGPVTVTARVEQPGTVDANSYQLSVDFIAGDRNTILKRATVSCARSGACGKKVVLRTSVRQAGTYYIAVEGHNAEHLWFSMTVQGHIRALHCNFKRHTC